MAPSIKTAKFDAFSKPSPIPSMSLLNFSLFCFINFTNDRQFGITIIDRMQKLKIWQIAMKFAKFFHLRKHSLAGSWSRPPYQ